MVLCVAMNTLERFMIYLWVFDAVAMIAGFVETGSLTVLFLLFGSLLMFYVSLGWELAKQNAICDEYDDYKIYYLMVLR